MMQDQHNQPIKIWLIREMAMGLTIPTISIGVALYLFFHFLLGGIFN